MSCIVDQMFPARLEDTSEDYTSFVFWREPIPEVLVENKSANTTLDLRSSVNNGTVTDTSSKKEKK